MSQGIGRPSGRLLAPLLHALSPALPSTRLQLRPGQAQLPAEKPLHGGGPGSAARLVGGSAAVLITLGAALAVFFLCHRRQKSQLGMDTDGTDLSPSQKPEPVPSWQSPPAPAVTQSLHPESQRPSQQEDEFQPPPLHPPYYDLGVSPSYQPVASGRKDADLYYAELDASALELKPGPQTVLPGSGDTVEYATIQSSAP